MTATLTETTAAVALVRLAGAYVAETLPSFEIHQAVDRLAHPALPPSLVWPLFQDLTAAVQLADDVNEGRAHWTAVCDELTGPEPSTAAYEIACERVTAATNALLNPRSAR